MFKSLNGSPDGFDGDEILMIEKTLANTVAITVAIIVAGGRGSRISDHQPTNDGQSTGDTQYTPKQYQLLGGRCMLDISIGAFTAHPMIDRVIVVIHRDDNDMYDDLISSHEKLLPPVIGGKTRQQSVHSGLLAADQLGNAGKILIHDGARPFVDHKTITNIIHTIDDGLCAVPAHLVADTLKKSNDRLEITDTVPRQNIYCAQTPQGFMLNDILTIHNNGQIKNTTSYTDDASMFEAAGKVAKIVISPSANFKITTSDDLARARMIVGEINKDAQIMHADIRTGTGYDVHALGPGDGIILCGHKIPFGKKLIGHSDADAALHALTDALLGTIGAGDIGTHFPPSDPRWKDASSDRFLKTATAMVANQGGRINNIDITIICEMPKIGPHRDQMRKKLANLCELAIERVSIKATTNEKLGFLGRSEGIAAIATTTVSFGTIK